MDGACNVYFFGLAPWGSGKGSKGQISFNFNYKVNFKDFYTKLCVFSQMKETKHIRRIFFILLPGSCPRGWTWVYLGQNQILCCCLSVMLSPPNPLDEIQLNFVYELLP